MWCSCSLLSKLCQRRCSCSGNEILMKSRQLMWTLFAKLCSLILRRGCQWKTFYRISDCLNETTMLSSSSLSLSSSRTLSSRNLSQSIVRAVSHLIKSLFISNKYHSMNELSYLFSFFCASQMNSWSVIKKEWSHHSQLSSAHYNNIIEIILNINVAKFHFLPFLSFLPFFQLH